MIPYGAREILDADERVLANYDLEKNNYAILIARAEPENSILEIVAAFSTKRMDSKLIVLGNYEPDTNAYHREVVSAASDEVHFLGAIYDAEIIGALRFFARFYIHGHQVGGTNPSLVEALGAGNAVFAHDNKFNRWVAKDSALYFRDIPSLSVGFERLFKDDDLVASLQNKSRKNFQQNFQWDDILKKYEKLLKEWLPVV
jgi:glycosyltransferase involved in cell wall biosynthesis